MAIQNKEQLVFLFFLNLNFGIACDILRNLSARCRRWLFWQTIHFLFTLLSASARWNFLSQNYACFPFSSFQWRLPKTFVFNYFFNRKLDKTQMIKCFLKTTNWETVPIPLYIKNGFEHAYFFTVTSHFASNILTVAMSVF